MSKEKPVKIVVIGDAECGKTGMIHSYIAGKLEKDYIPTTFGSYITEVELGGKQIDVIVWDTAGLDKYKNILGFQFPHADLIIVCYSIGCYRSYRNVTNKWWPQLEASYPGMPLILVGLKQDIRYTPAVDGNQIPEEDIVSYELGTTVERAIDAVAFLECSAKKNRGVLKVFSTATRVVLEARQKKKDAKRWSCIIS